MKAKGIRACSGLLLAGLLLSGCNVGRISSRDFAQPGTAPPAGATVAVLPFENPTNHPNAGQIAADLVSTELYGVGGVRMVEAARVRGRLPPILFLPLSAGAQEVLPTDRTDPGHLRPPFRAYEPPPPGYQPRPRRTESRRVYALPQGLNGLATFDRTLSQLCRRGAFLQEIDGLYWAATPDFRYGVAFSGGANLVDPQNRRQPGKVYFFRNQDSRCSVWVGDQAKLMPHYIGG